MATVLTLTGSAKRTDRHIKMKRLLTTILLTFFAAHLFGQANFFVEGRIVKTGSIVKSYNFYYQSQDSISLFFSDSSIIFINPAKTVKKEVTFSKTGKEPYTRVEYFRTNGEDSISKHFSGDKLNMVYTTRFDNLDRIVYYGMKDFNAGSTYDRSFEWAYEYRDSIISTGKIVIQTVFVANDKGGKDFHFRILNEYDKKNRKIKETRESKTNDPMAQITTYKYDDKDSLIEEKTDGIETELSSQHISTPCDTEAERQLTISNFQSINNLVKQLLIENKKIINSDRCENFIYKYNSPDKQTQLIIRKVKPYWEGGRNASFIVTFNQL